MNLLSHLRTQARANRLANHRLQRAMAGLSDAEYRAPRTSFFLSLADSHHILVVAINGKGVRCNSACSDVEDGAGQLARDLVHVRDHQQ